MLSTSKMFQFQLEHSHKPEDKLFKKNKFSQNFVSPLNNYKSSLNNNTMQLKKKYPSMDHEQIKSLLEELQNNVDMVSEIIEDKLKTENKVTEKRAGKQSVMDEQRSDSDSGCENKQEKLVLNRITDITVLKNSILKLYTKLTKEQREREELENKVAHLQKQNEHLKMSNKQLMNESMSQNRDLLENLDIC